MDHHSQGLTLKGTNQWALVTFALIGFILGYAANEAGVPAGAPSGAPTVAQPSPTPTPPAAPRPTAVPVAEAADADDDPFLGEEDAAVTLIEFTDYQCPFCGRHKTQTMSQIISEYVDSGKVKYVVRDFPLSFHNNAQKAGEASECADDQGKFWEMHEKLFDNQTSLDLASLKRFAGEVGLNQGTFDDCLDSGKHAQEVQNDMKDGQAAGVTGTPGFILLDKDGKGSKLSGAQPFASFKAAIDAAM